MNTLKRVSLKQSAYKHMYQARIIQTDVYAPHRAQAHQHITIYSLWYRYIHYLNTYYTLHNRTQRGQFRTPKTHNTRGLCSTQTDTYKPHSTGRCARMRVIVSLCYDLLDTTSCLVWKGIFRIGALYNRVPDWNAPRNQGAKTGDTAYTVD